MTRAESAYNFGLEHASNERWSEALFSFEASLTDHPDWPEANTAAAVAALKLGLLAKAQFWGARAVASDPHNPIFLINLGRIEEAAQNWDQSISLFHEAAQLGDLDAPFHLGRLLQRVQLPAAAVRVLEPALLKQPHKAEGWALLAASRCSCGQVAESIKAWDKAIELENAFDSTSQSRRLLALHYLEQPPDYLAKEHRHWGQLVEQAILPNRAAEDDKSVLRQSFRVRRVRVGYLSTHAVHDALRSFTSALFRYHDLERFDIIHFSDAFIGTQPAVNSSIKQYHDTSGLTNLEFLGILRNANLDILIDLGGHSSQKGRLPALAARAAPLQITAIGYPNTTGLTRIDYRLTDSIADPDHSDMLYTEHLLRLNPCFLCYSPPPEAPRVSIRKPSDPFVFGCFNAFPKLTFEVLALFTEILQAAPGSSLVLKCLEFFDPDVRSIALNRLMACGADPSRIQILPPARTQQEHLAAYGDMDLFLDPFPYNGTTTTCEALWMGVPGITLAGDSHVSRVGASLFSACGLQQGITHSKKEFVESAVMCARHPVRIRQQRLTMRAILERSPLLDGPGYTARWERLLLTALA